MAATISLVLDQYDCNYCLDGEGGKKAISLKNGRPLCCLEKVTLVASGVDVVESSDEVLAFDLGRSLQMMPGALRPATYSDSGRAPLPGRVPTLAAPGIDSTVFSRQVIPLSARGQPPYPQPCTRK